jgi:hypothetical protein
VNFLAAVWAWHGSSAAAVSSSAETVTFGYEVISSFLLLHRVRRRVSFRLRFSTYYAEESAESDLFEMIWPIESLFMVYMDIITR